MFAGEKAAQIREVLISESAWEELTRLFAPSIDMVGRYGGEEFVLFLDQVDAAGSQLIAERIRDNIALLALPHVRSATACYVTLSIGIAPWQPEATLESLCEQADQALYQAKRNGRNCHVLYADAATTE